MKRPRDVFDGYNHIPFTGAESDVEDNPFSATEDEEDEENKVAADDDDFQPE